MLNSLSAGGAAMHTPPTLEEIGTDLIGTTAWRRRLALARPAAAVTGYATTAATGHWVGAMLALFLVFTTVISLMHDTVHGSLGLRRRSTDITLFLAGALLLVSGHAYRATHIKSPSRVPRRRRPGGEAARLSVLSALAAGPLHVPRIWLWAFRRARRARRWLVVEA